MSILLFQAIVLFQVSKETHIVAFGVSEPRCWSSEGHAGMWSKSESTGQQR